MTTGPYRILIVDDSPEDREAYRRLLLKGRADQYLVVEADCGEEGLRICRDEPPDCVLLDYNLPDIDGVEFLGQLRAEDGETVIPVVLLTGQGNEGVAVQVMKQGAQDYLVKGRVTTESFTHSIHGAIEKAVLQRQIRRQSLDLERQNAVLREREELFRLFIENAPAAIAMLDSKLRYLSVSNRWLTDYGLVGHDSQGLCGRHHYEIFPETPEHWREVHRRCLAGAVERADEEAFKRADGSVQWLRWEVRPWHTSENAIGGIIIFSEDITARKRAEESLRESEQQNRYLAECLEQSDQPFNTGYSDGRIAYVNAAFERLTGYSRHELLALDWSATLTPPEWRSLEEAELEELRCTGEPVRYEKEYVRKDGSRVPVELLVHRVGNEADRVLQYYAFVTDLTERKWVEEAQRETDRRKDEFLAMLAHELRNPLVPIRNAAYIMGELDLVEPRLQWVQQTIENQVAHLCRLVDDLLDVSRIAQGKITLELERLDLSRLIRRAVENVAPFIQSKRHQLDVRLPQGPVWIMSDAVRLTQVMVNLLDNAAKYTPQGGSIEVSLDAVQQGVEITVRDSGIGVSPELLPHIFDPFQQGDRALDRSQGGLGLGLTLVRRLVILFGGQVSAFSAGPDQGSLFKIRLPVQADQSTVKAPSGMSSIPAGSRCRVLVVDDDPAVAKSTAMLLELQGHEVNTAASGEAALELVPVYRPDVILLDIGLSGMDGYEVARKLRSQQPDGDPLFLVAVSGYGDHLARFRTKVAGFDRHLVKPVPPNDLYAVLDERIRGNFKAAHP
ncbi:MAG: hypothetical protein H6R26_1535 [Proteobacteria bacterium]|nr:hypothetical protein [Pseudomonadota bacterium]